MGPHPLSASHASNNARIVPVRDVVGSGGGLPRERNLQDDTCSWMQGFVNYLLLTWQLQLNHWALWNCWHNLMSNRMCQFVHPHHSNRGEQRFIESIPHNWQFSEHGQFGLAELHSSHSEIIQRWIILAFTHKDNRKRYINLFDFEFAAAFRHRKRGR